MILLEEPYAKVTFTKEKQLGQITWNGKTTSEEYQKTFNTLLEFQKQNTISRYISDIKNQNIISPADRKWFETVAMPQAIDQGLKAAAVIFDGNAFKKYYLNIILGATKKFGLPMRIFNTQEEAEKWLLTH